MLKSWILKNFSQWNWKIELLEGSLKLYVPFGPLNSSLVPEPAAINTIQAKVTLIIDE